MARVNFHLSFTQITGSGVYPTLLKELVKNAEELGWDGITHGDEALLPPQGKGFLEGGHGSQYNQGHMSCLPLLAHFAAVTRKIQLSSNILIAPLYHPVHVANIGATIDNLSGGRFTLRTGTGLFPWEFEYFGLPWEHRGKILVESIEFIRALWTQDVVNYKGEYFHLENASLAAQKPIQKPHPPIWIGTAGNKEYLLKRVAKYADGWDMVYHWPSGKESHELSHRHDKATGVAQQFGDAVKFIKKEAKAAGRDPEAIRHSPGSMVLAIGKDDAQARKTADEYLSKVRGEDFSSPSSGDPARVINYINEYVEVGATDFTVNFVPYNLPDTMQMMELFANEVIPNFRR